MQMKRFGWAATALLCTMMALGGILHLTGQPDLAANIRHLGYPDYFQTMLGVSKLLGVAALLGPYAGLKEWAYAGFSFNLIAAFFSHLAVGDPVVQAIPSVAALAVLAVSYVAHFRPSTSRV
jgi:hypothetical protein